MFVFHVFFSLIKRRFVEVEDNCLSYILESFLFIVNIGYNMALKYVIRLSPKHSRVFFFIMLRLAVLPFLPTHGVEIHTKSQSVLIAPLQLLKFQPERRIQWDLYQKVFSSMREISKALVNLTWIVSYVFILLNVVI